MARRKIFLEKTSTPGMHKSLRTHAREAAEYLTGLPYLPPAPPKWPVKKPGRGVRGESAN